MKATLISLLFLLTTILFSCNSDEALPKVKSNPNVRTATCSSFWAEYEPSQEIKLEILEGLLNGENSLSGENKSFLKNLIKTIKRTYHPDTLLLTIDQPFYPIYRFSADQIGIIGFYSSKELDGNWEDITRENQLLSENFAYQSIDSLGKLCYFPEEFSELFNDAPPSVNIYSMSKKGRSRIKNLAYLGDDCLSYFQYDFSLSKENEKDSILFGSRYSLDLEFGSFPEIDKCFKEQFANGCMDCPTNFPDQKAFAKLKGVDNLYFTYADDFPVNTRLANPSRSLVYKNKEGKLITLWTVELDLSGCGCL